ncbi:hypothetical protein [Streptomyces sp. NK15101]|uniref:hypothetical protein n=1 Tax=Streptomyces sp. NK15101 TaxID=2873261 RepID=UPI001CEDD182|nr:hypothetical protein [Streptomyces sp. NK15101]
MLELVFFVAAAALVGWMMSRKQRQRSTATADGEPAGVPCMLKWSAQGSRWRAGRLLIGAGPLVWKPSLGRREAALPADLRQTGVRSPSLREAVAINPGSRIVECESSDGQVLIAVMPGDLDHVVKFLERA